MKTYRLHREQILPISLQQAWDFFSTPDNLSKITPENMGFEMLSKPVHGSVTSGMLIEYRVRPLLGIPMRWVTEIGTVTPPYSFTDTQLKGPYALFEHTHSFKEAKGGVQMTDDVKYAIPMGILGELAHTLFVKKKLSDIFDFRAETLKKYFSA